MEPTKALDLYGSDNSHFDIEQKSVQKEKTPVVTKYVGNITELPREDNVDITVGLFNSLLIRPISTEWLKLIFVILQNFCQSVIQRQITFAIC